MIDRVSIRMYRVGFGDCFLLRFWRGSQATRVLVDCGSITEDKVQIGRIVDSILEDCRDSDGTVRIPLVIATHRHRDHVGGFANPAWAEVEVDEVWMPWTEDPADPTATRIRNRQSSLAEALRARLGLTGEEDSPLAKVPARESAPEAERRVLQAITLNALTNAPAMARLHGGFAKHVKPVFLPAKDIVCEGRQLAGLGDLTIHVLGPPRDEKAIASMDPPAGAGYLTKDGTQDDSLAAGLGVNWQLPPEAFRTAAPLSTFSDKDIRAVDLCAEEPSGALAAALDKAVNNTSLILIFEVGDQLMLFPADAQWGAWNAALQEPTCKALLQRTNFYKVGHHGSHNATPRELIESLMPAKFTAMFSTTKVAQWPDIPRPPLVAAIAEKAARYARSDDEAAAKKAGFHVELGLFIETDIAIGSVPAPAKSLSKPRTASSPARSPAMEPIACTPKRLPADMQIFAAERAVAVNPANRPPLARLTLALGATPDKASLALLTAKKWHTDGVRLTVGFMEDRPADLRARILSHMNAWSKTADVQFTESNEDPQVRIAFAADGYWSYLGTDVLLIDKNSPTMNLEGFTMETPDSEFYRVVRHETGHTLGFPHEHMRRELVGQIDRERAIEYYGATQGWSRQQVELQVLTPIDEGSLLGTSRTDGDSIMCYQIPARLTKDGIAIPGGRDIDPLDYQFASTCYPKHNHP